MSTETKENRTLNEIANTLDKLDATTAKYDETDSKARSFEEYEKGFREIKKLISEYYHEAKLEDKGDSDAEDEDYDEKVEADAVLKIEKELDKLAVTLQKLEDTSSKIKGWWEEKKAEHEVKKILNEADTYDDFDADELELIADDYGFIL